MSKVVYCLIFPRVEDASGSGLRFDGVSPQCSSPGLARSWWKWNLRACDPIFGTAWPPPVLPPEPVAAADTRRDPGHSHNTPLRTERGLDFGRPLRSVCTWFYWNTFSTLRLVRSYFVFIFPCINSLITPLTAIITFRIIQGPRAIFIFILILQVYFTFNFNEITAELQRSHYINYYFIKPKDQCYTTTDQGPAEGGVEAKHGREVISHSSSRT